jgi:hypothetical protein
LNPSVSTAARIRENGGGRSLLNDLRVPVKIAREQLGHSSISTTLNIYTHVVDASHRKAIEALEREFFPSVPNCRMARSQPIRQLVIFVWLVLPEDGVT